MIKCRMCAKEQDKQFVLPGDLKLALDYCNMECFLLDVGGWTKLNSWAIQQFEAKKAKRNAEILKKNASVNRCLKVQTIPSSK